MIPALPPIPAGPLPGPAQRTGAIPGRAAPVARPASRPLGWDPILICTAIYILTAVARVHQLIKPLALIKPVLAFSTLGLLLFLVEKNKSRSVKLLKDPTSKAAFFIVAWASIAWPFGLHRSHSIIYLWEEVWRVGLLFLLIAGSVRNLYDVRRLMYVFGGGIVYLALIAMGQTHAGMRLGGASYDANDLGMVLVAAFSIGIYALTQARGTKHKIFAIVSLVALALATVETDSRGAFLALVAVIGYTLFFLEGVSKKWRLGAAAAVLGLMLYAATGAYWERMRTIFVPADDYNRSSLTGRMEIWKRGMGYMATHPLFGVGVDNFASAEGRSEIITARQAEGKGTKWSTAHSSWVGIGAEMGVPGLIALAVFYFGGITRLRRLSRMARAPGAPRELKEGAALGAALVGMLIGLAVAGTFVTQMFGYAAWAGAGLVAGLLKVMKLEGYDTGRRATARGRSRAPMSRADGVAR